MSRRGSQAQAQQMPPDPREVPIEPPYHGPEEPSMPPESPIGPVTDPPIMPEQSPITANNARSIPRKSGRVA